MATLALLDSILPNIRGSARVIRRIVSVLLDLWHWRFNPHRQLAYRIAHGPTEVFRSLPVHPLNKGCTDVGAVQPEFEVILLIGHGILEKRKSESHRRRIGGRVP